MTDKMSKEEKKQFIENVVKNISDESLKDFAKRHNKGIIDPDEFRLFWKKAKEDIYALHRELYMWKDCLRPLTTSRWQDEDITRSNLLIFTKIFSLYNRVDNLIYRIARSITGTHAVNKMVSEAAYYKDKDIIVRLLRYLLKGFYKIIASDENKYFVPPHPYFAKELTLFNDVLSERRGNIRSIRKDLEEIGIIEELIRQKQQNFYFGEVELENE